MEKAKTQTRPWLVRVNLRELGVGLCLVWLGFFMPVFFTVGNFHILDTLYFALDHGEKTGLMLAALKLVALNSLRGIPHYIGAFLIAESVEYRWKEHNLWAVNALMVIVVLLCTYRGIDALHRVHYDFGLPAILVAALLLVFEKMDYQYITITKKVMFIAILVVTFQFLDIMPAANGLPMGRGEISGDVKLASKILDANPAMNAMAAAGLVVFLLMLVLLFFQLRVENNLRQLNILREQNLAIRTEARMNEMKNRTYREMQYLVHDLKSPLASAQTLVGVIKMECEAEGRTQDVEYLGRIEGAVEQMSRMISEILYEEQATPETVERLVDRALAQLSVESYAAYVHTELKTPEAMVRVNRVLFPRALVNLVQNSAKASPAGRTPDIRLRVDTQEGMVRFTVEDNGKGIPKSRQQAVWNKGYSTSQSSGLGLPFVRSVVERVGGTIQMNSTVDQGTTFTLIIPEEERHHAE